MPALGAVADDLQRLALGERPVDGGLDILARLAGLSRSVMRVRICASSPADAAGECTERGCADDRNALRATYHNLPRRPRGPPSPLRAEHAKTLRDSPHRPEHMSSAYYSKPGVGNATWPACTCMRPSSAQRCSVGNTLPGLSRPLASKAHLSALLLVEVDLGEHRRHQVALLDADAVLAGEHAADLDAELQDVGAECLGRARARPACWRRRG